jgi:hypothetical protein
MKFSFSNRQLLILTFLGFYFSSNSQVSIGLSSGLNLSWLHYTYPISSFKIGDALLFKSGVNLEYRFPKHFSLINSTDFVKKGGKTISEYIDRNGNSAGSSTVYTILNCIENTTFLKYRFNFNTLKPFYTFGFSFAYLNSGKQKADYILLDGHYPRYDYSNPIDLSLYNRYDFSLNAGLGCEIQIKKNGFIFLESRYQHGFSDISSYVSTLKRLNRSIAITMGYAFIFVKKKKVD